MSMIAVALYCSALLGRGSDFNAIQSLADLRKFSTDQMAEAKTKGTREAQMEARNAVIARVKEAVKDVNLADVTPADCLPYSQLLAMGAMFPEALVAVEKYIPSVTGVEQHSGHLMAMTYSMNTENLDSVVKHVNEITYQNSKQVVGMASRWVGGPFYLISEKKGSKVAIEAADALEAKLLVLPVTDVTDKITIRIAFVETVAETLAESGDTAGALNRINAILPEVDAKAARGLNAMKTRLSMVGVKAPMFVYEKGYGTPETTGKVVMYDFFAHWCPPCKAAFPGMVEMYSDLKPKGLEIVGVTTYYGYYASENREKRDMKPEDEYARMEGFRKDFKMEWPVMFGTRENFEKVGLSGIPHVILVDRKGIVRRVKVGFDKAGEAAFRAEIEALLAEKA
jgi:thiol-disulfide isomerase/thioredoxin